MRKIVDSIFRSLDSAVLIGSFQLAELCGQERTKREDAA